MADAKQVIVIRRDLKMRRGKEIAQGAHAAMAWLSRDLVYEDYDGNSGLIAGQATIAFTNAELAWLQGAFRKITCQVPDEVALRAVHEKAARAGVLSILITDAGLTEFGGVPTVTALAVGPDWDHLVDAVTGELSLY